MACMNKSNSEDVCVRVQNKIQDLTGVYVGYKNLDIYLENFKQITNIVTLLGSVLASLSLIVGGIGLTSNMLNKTEQRKYEIGVYLSIGASKKDICLMFLFEAILICLFGGVVGWGISSALFDVLSDYIGNVIVSDSKIALYGVFVSGICGVLFGLFPAVKAASMKPIDAIRC
jgi:macrolide transport system ATP-binding/permease protein